MYFPGLNIVVTITFIIGSVLFLVAAIIDLCRTINIENLFFLCGGTFFTVGSFLFLSTITEYAGLWVFRCGSVSYITGSSIIVYKLYKTPKNLNIVASIMYITGSSLFLLGNNFCI